VGLVAAAAAPAPNAPDHLAVYADPERYGLRLVRGVLHVEDVPLPAIAAAAGTPTYVYSGAHIGARHDELARACDSHPTLLCYAVKANSSQAVLRTLARRGAGADFVWGGYQRRGGGGGVV
jgi:diaminopimelate decarboxylase